MTANGVGVSLRTPNEAYLKSRRALVVTSGLLLLSVFIGITPESGDGTVAIFSMKIKSADSIPTVLFIILLYAVWQFWSSWFIQSNEIREFVVNKIDVLVTLFIALFAVAAYLWPIVRSAVPSISQITQLVFSVVSAFGAGLAFFYTNSRLRSVLVNRFRRNAARLNKILIDGSWTLVFNPKHSNGSKPITFLTDGEIGLGRNDNESRWRIQEGTLELVNSAGRIFSRFRYNDSKRRFEHTNDQDTLSLRDQLIVRPVPEH